ncbi:hypothetical protein CRM22_011044 [Opisthorchis felineus]|nr:hypothetical protein CRM22_011044 [Opisthorchis felineus]
MYFPFLLFALLSTLRVSFSTEAPPRIWYAESLDTRVEYCRMIWWRFVKTCPHLVDTQKDNFLIKVPWKPAVPSYHT